jgi:hypothetical protein
MHADVQRDFDGQRRYIPAMKRIVGEYLVGEAPPEEDMQHNTDLIVLRLEAVRIACRVRDFEYLSRRNYANEFTLRSGRPSGIQTELQKVLAGWGDFILYGFKREDDSPELAAWVLGDLKVFRLWCFQWLVEHRGVVPGNEVPNTDHSSKFRAFTIEELPPSFVRGRLTCPVPVADPFDELPF